MSTKAKALTICEVINSQLAAPYLCHEFGGGIIIVSPFEYPDGSPVQLLAKQGEQSVHLTDMGMAYSYLADRGWRPRRRGKIEPRIGQIMRRHGVESVVGEIGLVLPDLVKMGNAAHRISLASKEVADLAQLLTPQRPGDLSDRVIEFFEDHSIAGYRQKQSVMGSSGSQHVVDIYFQQDPTFIESISPHSKAYKVKRGLAFTAFADIKQGQKIVVVETPLPASDERMFADVADEMIVWNRETDRQRLMNDLEKYRSAA